VFPVSTVVTKKPSRRMSEGRHPQRLAKLRDAGGRRVRRTEHRAHIAENGGTRDDDPRDGTGLHGAEGDRAQRRADQFPAEKQPASGGPGIGPAVNGCSDDPTAGTRSTIVTAAGGIGSRACRHRRGCRSPRRAPAAMQEFPKDRPSDHLGDGRRGARDRGEDRAARDVDAKETARKQPGPGREPGEECRPEPRAERRFAHRNERRQRDEVRGGEDPEGGLRRKPVDRQAARGTADRARGRR